MMSVLVLVVLLSGNLYEKIQKEEKSEMLNEEETAAQVIMQSRTMVGSSGIDETDTLASQEDTCQGSEQTGDAVSSESASAEKEVTSTETTSTETTESREAETESELESTETEASENDFVNDSVEASVSYTALGNIQTTVCEEYRGYVDQICSAYGISPELVVAIIESESGGVSTAYNGTYGCVGLMQINESVHRGRMAKLGVENLYDPYSNILVGVDLLDELLENDDQNVYMALGHYHGEKNVKSRTRSGNYSRYVKKIMERMTELQAEQGKI